MGVISVTGHFVNAKRCDLLAFTLGDSTRELVKLGVAELGKVRKVGVSGFLRMAHGGTSLVEVLPCR